MVGEPRRRMDGPRETEWKEKEMIIKRKEKEVEQGWVSAGGII
jgi:hypothetical protein